MSSSAEPRNPGHVDSADVLDRIRTAFVHGALLDHATITVRVVGDAVTLTGTVGSRAEQTEAGRIAGTVPGVGTVRNHVAVVVDAQREPFRR